MTLEIIYQEWLHRVYKEVKNHLDYHISNDASKGKRAHDKLGGETCGAEYLYTAGKEDNCPVHCRSKVAGKEGSNTASSVNVSIPMETARSN